ncbi:DUF1934 domain-containing protein [Paenibacillus sp. GCM10012306]|uniref:DUF1934 domain-containing protein n=1 Tax=Paenibacillus sp. GCM10012306 TaxID=3317342 RepID=UPI00361F77F0
MQNGEIQVPEIESHKYGVSVTLVSEHEGERTVLNTAGEVIAKGQQLFIRYVEPGQGPQGEETAIRTTIKIAGSELKLIRHGAVESEQSFRQGKRLPGFYRSPYTQFNLSTETRELEISRDGRSLNVTWEYDLYVYEELSGQFTLSLHIQEEPKS